MAFVMFHEASASATALLSLNLLPLLLIFSLHTFFSFWHIFYSVRRIHNRTVLTRPYRPSVKMDSQDGDEPQPVKDHGSSRGGPVSHDDIAGVVYVFSTFFL